MIAEVFDAFPKCNAPRAADKTRIHGSRAGQTRRAENKRTGLFFRAKSLYLGSSALNVIAMIAPRIIPLDNSPKTLPLLCAMLVDVVAAGGSVSFMYPLDAAAADHFWTTALAAAARNERVVLGAWDNDELLGTVTLLLDCPPNQPHRAEIAKLMTLPAHRRRGIAAALVREAERVAVQHGKTLLVLDTAADGGASSLYSSLGFTHAGTIPDYALKPHGGLTGTMIYWKKIG
jgi:ribosomal protein S18 acetylase RimI-like enzyme